MPIRKEELSGAERVMATLELMNLNNILDPLVKSVRSQLAGMYDVENPKSYNYRYTDLCDAAVDMLRNEILIHNTNHNDNLVFDSFHGEQKHSPRIESRFWSYQHTWCSVTSRGVTVYVDPTCSQFQWLYDDIPDYYIGIEEPKWFYPDSRNPSYSIIGNKLNDYRITYKTRTREGTEIVRIGLIYFFQFIIWGGISDAIHRMIKRR